jgi:hypothetical protein
VCEVLARAVRRIEKHLRRSGVTDAADNVAEPEDNRRAHEDRARIDWGDEAHRDRGLQRRAGRTLLSDDLRDALTLVGWAPKIDFNKMTHLLLAFGTVDTGNNWNFGAADNDVKTIAAAAHAKNVKVVER